MKKKKVKKPFYKKWWFWFIAVLAVAALFGVGEQEEITPAEPTATEIVAVTETPQVGYWENNPLDAINLSAEEKRNLYDDLETAFDTVDYNLSSEEIRAREDACVNEVAAKYGVSYDEARNIYWYAIDGYLYDIDPASIKVKHGETESVIIRGNTMIIKAKIEASLTDKMTVEQNYFNVDDIIRNQNGNQFHKIEYWAVADMRDGSTSKVIQFDLDKNIIEAISKGNILPIEMGEYVSNLWLLPSLR